MNNIGLETGLPANIDAERFVLGSILLEADAMHDVRAVCRLLGSLLTRHAAGMEAAYKAYASGWRGEEERIL